MKRNREVYIIVDALLRNNVIQEKDAEKAVKALTDTVAEALKAGDKVQLVGFGTFEARKRAARTGRNPQTGKEIKIAAKTVPAFSAGKKFKEAVK